MAQLKYKTAGGLWEPVSSGGGTSDYTGLTNKPQIEGVTLSGNKTAADLGLAKSTDIPSVPSASSATPQPLGTAAAGSSGDYSRADHVHAKPTAADVGAVSDVQVNGTSVVTSGVANVPVAGANKVGAVAVNAGYGLAVGSSNNLYITEASSANIKGETGWYNPITPHRQNESVFYGLAKAAGDSTQSSSSNAVGVYTESAKSAISTMLDAPETVSGTTPSITAKSGVRYICGEVATLTIVVPSSGIIDVTFDSGSTPTVLTVTPPTGMTMRWIGDDPTALEANKHYEVNIMDGCNGMVVSWT